jgi:hypothetical protein
MEKLVPPQALDAPGVDKATITGKRFFPELISDPFEHGIRIAFTMSMVMFLVAAVASYLRGPARPGTEDRSDVQAADADAVEQAALV